MTKLDGLIRDALEDQDKALVNETRELGWFELGLGQFIGKLGWVTWLIMLLQSTMFIAGAYCAIQFYSAADGLVAVKWGLTSATLLIMALSLKTSLMPQMQADRVIREVKRLELLLISRDG